MKPSGMHYYTLCTGGPYEDPDHWGDECDFYALGVRNYRFYGTLEQAKEKARQLAQERESHDSRAEYGIISVNGWVLDEQGNWCP